MSELTGQNSGTKTTCTLHSSRKWRGQLKSFSYTSIQPRLKTLWSSSTVVLRSIIYILKRSITTLQIIALSRTIRGRKIQRFSWNTWYTIIFVLFSQFAATSQLETYETKIAEFVQVRLSTKYFASSLIQNKRRLYACRHNRLRTSSSHT